MRLQKRSCGIALCIILLINALYGCGESNLPMQEMPVETAQETGAGTVSEEPVISAHGTGSRLMNFDPQRIIYFSCDGMDVDMDLYMWYTCGPGFRFYIYSLNALDLDTLQIEIPVETEYEVSATARDVSRAILTEGKAEVNSAEQLSCFPYYLYQIYRDTDFEKIKQLWEASDPEFRDYRDAELGSFYSLKESDIPEFFVYQVRIDFDIFSCKKDEAFNQMTIKLEGQTYSADIGEVRLHATASPYTIETSRYYTNESGIASAGQLQRLYNDGLGSISGLFQITAAEDMMITGLKTHGNDLDILELYVEQTGSNPISCQWDGTSPIYLCQGDTLLVNAVYRSEKTNNISYYIRAHFELDYETDRENACISTEYTLLPRDVNLHEWFAIVFMGVDMEPYYRNYYYPLYEPWRQDYLS